MGSSRYKTGRIVAPQRSASENAEIARAIETDPKGELRVNLDFENGTFDGWSIRRLPKPDSAMIQSEIFRVGSRACRFTISPGEFVSQGARAELRDWYNAPLESETYYGFSTYLPESFRPPAGVGVVVAQWHDQAEIGDPSGKPPLAIRYLNGSLRFTGAYSNIASDNPERAYLFAELENISLGSWSDYIFRIFWSRQGDSQVEAWLNGQPLFAFTGPLGYRNQVKGPYFKIGVYASGHIDEPLVVYHDNYNRGLTREEVDPSILHRRIE